MIDPTLKPEYSNSHALIIGINKYKKASPLLYAVNDAQGIASILSRKYDFPIKNIRSLIDKDATRKNIISAYLAYAKDNTEINDRLLVFFAGHGYTETGQRGEIGFLIPHDGNVNDLSTLIRWDELTLNSELIKAKHIFFIMDACYGGLAFTRSFSPGSMRFLKNMYLRPVRQVLTAGKADEVVSDSGGPKPNHSVFTGHLLEALEGNAASEGIITANRVMAYTYNKVSTDIHSRQTPHYGSILGDGDLIFQAPIMSSLTKEEKEDNDILITFPPTEITASNTGKQSISDQVKEYISDPKYKIKLDDFVVKHVRNFIIKTAEDKFPVEEEASVNKAISRIEQYENISRDLKQLIICISYWGNESHHSIIQKAIVRTTEQFRVEGGYKIWNELRWYPILIFLYSSGIAAIAANKFDNLYSVLMNKVFTDDSPENKMEFIFAADLKIASFTSMTIFKNLPGHERNYVPLSEYLFKSLQPDLDDILFLGKEYEHVFDRFEVLFALIYADYAERTNNYFGGPIGRFGWKYHSRFKRDNPFLDIIAEANEYGEKWLPLKAGFFQGNLTRFKDVASRYEEYLKRLNWL